MDSFWQSAVDFVAVHLYISPFWYWVFVGAVTVAITTAMAWYFSPLRPLAGAVFLAVIAGLTGYRRGEHDAERHDAAVRPKPEPKQGNGWWN